MQSTEETLTLMGLSALVGAGVRQPTIDELKRLLAEERRQHQADRIRWAIHKALMQMENDSLKEQVPPNEMPKLDFNFKLEE